MPKCLFVYFVLILWGTAKIKMGTGSYIIPLKFDLRQVKSIRVLLCVLKKLMFKCPFKMLNFQPVKYLGQLNLEIFEFIFKITFCG